MNDARLLGLVFLCSTMACEKPGAPPGDHAARTPAPSAARPSSSSSSGSSSEASASTPSGNGAPGAAAASTAVAAGAVAAAHGSLDVAPAPPASFSGGAKETVDAAVGLGCEARRAQGWLELLCRKKNGTGGHPIRAILGPESSEEIRADEHGELRLVVPFRGGESKDVTIEWTDTRYVLRVSGASAKLEWVAGTVALRKACTRIQDEAKQRLSEAQKAAPEARVLAGEIAKLPRFGVCQAGGFGSWALAPKSLSGSGEGAARRLRLELDVSYVSEQGTRVSAPFGSFEFAPGTLKLAPLRVYDYDDDGQDELIAAYELTSAPAAAAAPLPPMVWSLSAAGIAPYARAPSFGAAGAAIEQLDFDMRPDFSDFGPFVTNLGSDCGAKSCPARLTGPRFFFHSLPDGAFSRDDAAAKAALKRACPKRPEAVVALAGSAALVPQTANNVVCARVHGVASENVTAELTAKRAALCGDAASCPLATLLESWAALAPPATLP